MGIPIINQVSWLGQLDNWLGQLGHWVNWSTGWVNWSTVNWPGQLVEVEMSED